MSQECPLYGKEECRLLNMARCEECPITTGEEPEKIIRLIETYKQDTKGVDIPGLFTGEECRLCKKEPKKKSGYMLFDLGHIAKNGKETRGWRKLLKSGGPEYDILLPLQFNCCASCRKHLWWDANLVTVTTVGLILLTLIPVSIELSVEKLRAVNRLMPIIVLVAAGLVGYFGGKLLHKSLRKKWAEDTLLDLSEHPASQTLFKQGWQPALINSSKKEAVMFTKKPLERGLGTAPKAAVEPAGEEASVPEKTEAQ